jgi:hypothetical protein
MAPETVERPDTAAWDAWSSWLAEHTRAWTDAGIISDAQAATLREFEHVDGALPATPPPRIGPVAEAAAYVGTMLALVGAVVGLAPEWGGFPLAVRVAIAAALAVVGFAAGAWAHGLDDRATDRVASFLWVLGVGGIGLAAGTAAVEAFPDSMWIAVTIGAPVAVAGAGLWRNLDRPLQLLTAVVGAALVAIGLGQIVGVPTWAGGIALWTAATTAWALTMRFDVRPIVLARCLAGGFAIVGAFMLIDVTIRLGAAVALATASAVVILALRLHTTAVLVIGVLGASMAVQTLVQTTFHGPVGGAVVALVGVVTVLAIVLRARRRPRPST